MTLGESAPAVVQLVELGDPRRNIPPCAACHRAGAGGPVETPVLAEQWSEYIVQQLKLYASGERRNDVYARMRTIAPKLTSTEIAGLQLITAPGLDRSLDRWRPAPVWSDCLLERYRKRSAICGLQKSHTARNFFGESVAMLRLGIAAMRRPRRG